MSLFKMKGLHVPHRKNTAKMPAVRMPAPKTVTIPLSMHIGAPAKCIVSPGEHVDIGQKIADAGGFVSAPVHSSVSGTVKKITDFLLSNGSVTQAVVIESDGEGRISADVVPPKVNDYESFIRAVRESGCVGLGGAGFPTSVKLAVGDLDKIKEIIINGAECEPYITSDTRTMIDKAELIKEGCRTLKTYLNVKKIYIGVEKNKPEAIAKMKQIADEDEAVTLKVLPSVYPQGGEKVLIYNVTGKIVPEGKLPLDVGSIVINCTTLAFLQEYLNTGMPLVEKCVTVDGSAVKDPQNVIVPIGSAVGEVFEFCGGFISEPKKILMGGPMMGLCVYSLDAPVVKNNNALIALDKKDAEPPKTTACIRCGACIQHCPLHLNPYAVTAALDADDCEAMSSLKVNICMECGCCSYVCPARRPLVQQNKIAKARLAAYIKKKAEDENKKSEARTEAAVK